ncbi:MAG: transglycosylase domain-containing protein [Armatimonadota bacterium]
MSKQLSKPREFLRRQRWYRFFRAITLMILISSAFMIGIVAGLFAAVSKVLPKGEDLADIRPPVPTRILASDGSLLAKVYYQENREMVPFNSMGNMINATLDIEDIRFYSHPGIDPIGIARAMVKNIASGDTKEGASTVTQQLARNLYLSREKKLTRKLSEMIIALELERRYSKQEILETYLNQVYYGANTYGLQSWGVQMAAKNYFGKDVGQLTIGEAALLAGLPKNPRDYSPYRHRKAALQRRKLVLNSMLANGHIGPDEYKQAVNEPLKLVPQIKLDLSADWHAPYFVRYILTRELKKIFGQDWEQYTYHYGITIHTSLDPRMQKVAEDTVTRGIEKNKFRRIDDGAMIAIDPQTGFIKALVGGTDYRKDQFDIITQGRRQPGSAFKPFNYTTALIHGYTPDTTVFDRPGRYPSGTGQYWKPKNSDGRYRGAMPLKRALWLSRNAAAASVAYDVGMNNIIDTAHRMGIKYKLDPYLSTSLGASVVVPLEICSAYGTLANGGVLNPPTGIQRITTPDGEVLYEYHPLPQRSLPTTVANTMQEMMRGVIERGTARAARCPFPASGKTGTTNSYKDAWFIGYTDDLVAAVWVGNRDNQPMNRTYGGTVPAPIWHDFMIVAQPIMAAEHQDRASELARANSLPELTGLDTTPTPYILKITDGQRDAQAAREARENAQIDEQPVSPRNTYKVTVCQDSGVRATRWCPETMVVTYVKGRLPAPPSGYCTIHTGPDAIPLAGNEDETRPRSNNRSSQRGVVISICAETGKIATDKCPVVLRRRFVSNAPIETCPLHGE